MKHIQTEIHIDCPTSKVWEVLTNFEEYPKWNPFITSIIGNAGEGERLNIWVTPPDGQSMKFKPIILRCETNRELRWLGKLGFGGIFNGEHYFKLERINDDACKFIHGERFTGLLVAFMSKALENTERGFQQMNEALKLRCEQS